MDEITTIMSNRAMFLRGRAKASITSARNELKTLHMILVKMEEDMGEGLFKEWLHTDDGCEIWAAKVETERFILNYKAAEKSSSLR